MTPIQFPIRIKHLGGIPKILRDNPVLMGPFGTGSHDVSGHAIAEAFEASDYVYYQMKGLPRDIAPSMAAMAGADSACV
jgi:hypothetical protein